MNRCLKAAAVAAATLVVSALAAAGEYAPPAGRDAGSAVPIKDCTRFNGRHGYYGNPWCTAEEQARWDKWEADRLRKQAEGVTGL